MSNKIFNDMLKNLIIVDSCTNEVLAIIPNKNINTDTLYSDKLNIYLDYGNNTSIYKINENGKIFLIEGDKK